jgi:hypothetical protein
LAYFLGISNPEKPVMVGREKAAFTGPGGKKCTAQNALQQSEGCRIP